MSISAQRMSLATIGCVCSAMSQQAIIPKFENIVPALLCTQIQYFLTFSTAMVIYGQAICIPHMLH